MKKEPQAIYRVSGAKGGQLSARGDAHSQSGAGYFRELMISNSFSLVSNSFLLADVQKVVMYAVSSRLSLSFESSLAEHVLGLSNVY